MEDLQNMQNQKSMHLVLPTDAKPRLKWTPQLHQRFLEAMNQLGGPHKATPKSLMKVMEIPGLTLYHLKSHLQKFRFGKSQQLEITSSDNKQDCREIHVSDHSQNHITESSLQISQTLQMQMEVQRKLYEQIEVQRHLQLRIEAQGKYLQSVLNKAKEVFAGYTSSSSSTSGMELSKTEASQLISVTKNNACPNSPISELTETRRMSFEDGKKKKKKQRGTMFCSLESSLTSSESSEEKEESNEAFSDRKRSEGSHYDGKRCSKKQRKFELCEMIDLNRQYYESDID